MLTVFALLLGLNSAAAQQIPAGYVLVPLETLLGQTAPGPAVATAAISATKSSLRAGDEIGYVGQNASTVTATLRDESGQPLAGHKVSLISSRATDNVRGIQANTNANGEAIFSVAAGEEGVSSLTAIDQTSGVTIAERPRVVFLKWAGGIGGDLLRSDVLAESDPVVAPDKQIAATFPSSTTADSPSDIAVSVTDLSGIPIETFAGTISFASSDPLAVLPRDYTFTELDRGSHTFANAVTFTTLGLQSVTVDSGDTTISPATLSVTVQGATNVAAAPVVTSPDDGALINGVVTLLGITEANSNLAVFIDSQFFIEGSSDGEGTFLIDLNLTDGDYELTLALLGADSSVGELSEPVRVTIDTAAPVLTDISIDPGNKVQVGTTAKVIVQSEAALASATLKVAGDVLPLTEAEAGIYTVELEAAVLGTYSLNVELADSAGNVGNYPEATVLLVENALTIKDVQTTPRDGRIDLRWEPPINHAEIDHYSIYYGTVAENLDHVFNTLDNRTAWYIGDLQNDTVHYFQVNSLDAAGKNSGHSEVVQATPSAVLVGTGCDSKILLSWKTSDDPAITGYRLDYGIASRSYVESRVLPDGTDRTQWEIRDLINDVPYFIALRGTNGFGEVVYSPEEVSATPIAGACHAAPTETPIQLWQREDADGKTILVWNPDPAADAYQVYAGTEANYFDLPTVTVATPYFRPEGLTAGEDYFFAVRATYGSGHAAENISNIAKIEVGPAALLAIALATALGGTWLARRKRTSS